LKVVVAREGLCSFMPLLLIESKTSFNQSESEITGSYIRPSLAFNEVPPPSRLGMLVHTPSEFLSGIDADELRRIFGHVVITRESGYASCRAKETLLDMLIL
jgi:hypothetical protein